MRPQFATVGPLVAPSATNIRTALAVLAAGAVLLDGTLVSGGVATLDTGRRVLLTTTATNTGITVTLVGTRDGVPATEVITLAGATTYQSVLDYNTLASASTSAALTGNLSIGTNGVASSPWVKFDHWIDGRVALQVVVSGTVSYTVQQTLDDPDLTSNPAQPGYVAPQSVTWFSSSDPAVVAATTSQQSNYAYAPVYARILLNSQTNPGFVTGTFIQNGQV